MKYKALDFKLSLNDFENMTIFTLGNFENSIELKAEAMTRKPDCQTTPTFRYLRILQRVIIIVLLFIMSLILLLATFNVIYFIVKNIIQEPLTQLAPDNLMELFSIFLVILIGIELLETVKAFLLRETIQVEIVVLVAIIAVARKVIIWEFTNGSTIEIFGLSAILLSLGLTYFLIRKTRFNINLTSKKPPIIKKGKLNSITEKDKSKD
jgi:uncharacterized membrane protein (DUF373 family)